MQQQYLDNAIRATDGAAIANPDDMIMIYTYSSRCLIDFISVSASCFCRLLMQRHRQAAMAIVATTAQVAVTIATIAV